MEIDEAIKFTEKQISDLEKAVFVFDTVVAPRANADKKILAELRDQNLKMKVIRDKMKAGEDVSSQEIKTSIPTQFQ